MFRGRRIALFHANSGAAAAFVIDRFVDCDPSNGIRIARVGEGKMQRALNIYRDTSRKQRERAQSTSEIISPRDPRFAFAAVFLRANEISIVERRGRGNDSRGV